MVATDLVVQLKSTSLDNQSSLQAQAKQDALHKSFYPTHGAILAGDLEQLTKLLEAGNDAQQPDYDGVTPLHLACTQAKATEMVELLLHHKASVHVKSRSGATPLDIARSSQNTEVIALLTDAGAAATAIEPLASKPPVNQESVAALRAASGLTPLEVAAMQSAWDFLASKHKPASTKKTVSSLGVALFTLLFERHPALLDLFSFKAAKDKAQQMEAHSVRVLTTLGAILGMLDNFPKLASTATDLVTRHIKYGVLLEHYDQVLGVVAEFLSTGLGALGLWDDLQATAWTKLVTLVKAVAAGAYDKPASTESP